MKRGHIFLLAVILALLLVAGALYGAGRAVGAQATPQPGVAPDSEPAVAAEALAKGGPIGPTSPAKAPAGTLDTCPVTLPPDSPFTPPPPYPPEAPYAGKFWHGTEELWTMLPDDGTWQQLAYGEKLFWWREGYTGSEEPQPELAVTARRLDGQAPAAHSGPLATNAYHSDFHWAMLVGMQVATSGCWQITGHYQGHELSFVVWVGPG